ncbi:MAG: antitoxin [Actinomyces sp.]|nr:MAG: antitoxin [Actinomyces sp.]
MPTLYVRDVPEDVAEELKARAAAEGVSLSAYVAAQLALIASRPTNAQVVRRLRSQNRTDGPSTAQVVAAVRVGRR